MEGSVQVWSGLAPSSLLARVGISALCFHCLQFGFDIPRWPETVLLPELKPRNVLSDAFTRTMEGSLFGLKRLSEIRQDQGKFLLIFVLVTRHMISCSTLRCFGPQGPWVWRNTFAPYHIVRRWSPYHHDWCCFLRILAMPSSCLLFIIEEALPIEKGNIQEPNQIKSYSKFCFFAETESAWMQNRIVGRIHMAALSHRSRSDDAAEQKFQIPKTDRNYGVKQSPNCTTDT